MVSTQHPICSCNLWVFSWNNAHIHTLWQYAKDFDTTIISKCVCVCMFAFFWLVTSIHRRATHIYMYVLLHFVYFCHYLKSKKRNLYCEQSHDRKVCYLNNTRKRWWLSFQPVWMHLLILLEMFFYFFLDSFYKNFAIIPNFPITLRLWQSLIPTYSFIPS